MKKVILVIIIIILLIIIFILSWGIATNWGETENDSEIIQLCEEACISQSYSNSCIEEISVWFDYGPEVSEVTCGSLIREGKLNLSLDCKKNLCEYRE